LLACLLVVCLPVPFGLSVYAPMIKLVLKLNEHEHEVEYSHVILADQPIAFSKKCEPLRVCNGFIQLGSLTQD
jgi:hypothetical protein